MDGYTFSHQVRVRFAETDAQAIAHHASYVVWLEEARVAYLAAYAGGYQSIREQGIEALTTGVHVEYARAAGFDDVLTICSTNQAGTRVGRCDVASTVAWVVQPEATSSEPRSTTYS